MQHMQSNSGMQPQMAGVDWSKEITAAPLLTEEQRQGTFVSDPSGHLFPMGTMPQMRNDLPQEVIQSPLTVEEAHQGSLKAMLSRNEGNYVVATFLVGTQGTVSWEGILYDVGNDFITIYQPGRERYVVIDIYALKYIEFYDTRRREECEAMLKQNGWQNEH